RHRALEQPAGCAGQDQAHAEARGCAASAPPELGPVFLQALLAARRGTEIPLSPAPLEEGPQDRLYRRRLPEPASVLLRAAPGDSHARACRVHSGRLLDDRSLQQVADEAGLL